MSIVRSKSQKHKDRLKISDWYLKGYTQQWIAGQLGLNVSTICRDIKVLIRWWKRSSVKNIDSLKQIELNKINKLEIEYWEAWERSKNDAEQKIKRQRQTANNEPINEAQIKSDSQNGDPRYLAGVQWCIEKRCKIIGIDAPEKHEVMTKDITVNFGKLTDDELDTAIKLAERIRGDAV